MTKCTHLMSSNVISGMIPFSGEVGMGTAKGEEHWLSRVMRITFSENLHKGMLCWGEKKSEIKRSHSC